MKRIASKVRWLCVVMGAIVIAAGTANACSIPVFRYALDRWGADAYRIEVAEESLKDTEMASLLRNLGDRSPVNLAVTSVKNSQSHESRLLFPRNDAEVWSGVLSAEVLTQLTDSPARKEVVKRLLNGESGVWILLESGSPELDNAEAARLEKRIAFLETVADLPMIDPSDPTSRLGPGPKLGVKFSLLRLTRDNTRENIFRNMLLGPDWNRQQPVQGTVAAVVFGRGRVLGAWPTQELGDESVDEACLFLLGACSCQVKQLNPGWDLMMSVDWDQSLREVEALGVAGAPEPKVSPADAMVETVTIRPRVTKPPVRDAEEKLGNPNTRILIAGIGILLALGIAAGFYSRGQ